MSDLNNVNGTDLPLGFLLNTLGAKLFARSAAACADMDIELVHLGILWLIDLAPGLQQNDYAAFQMRDSTTFGRMVQSLEQKGYVRREKSSSDGRGLALFLTEPGRSILRDGKHRCLTVEKDATRMNQRVIDAAKNQVFDLMRNMR